jgi:hypothetical protein
LASDPDEEHTPSPGLAGQLLALSARMEMTLDLFQQDRHFLVEGAPDDPMVDRVDQLAAEGVPLSTILCMHANQNAL